MSDEPTVEEVRELLGDAVYCVTKRHELHLSPERAEHMAALCRDHLAAQGAEDERPAPDLPQAIKDELFKQACLCANTEAAAQKQPCACRTAMLLEQIEQWGKSLTKPPAKPQMSAGEFAGDIERRIMAMHKEATRERDDTNPIEAGTFCGICLGLIFARTCVYDAACEHNIEIVRPKR